MKIISRKSWGGRTARAGRTRRSVGSVREFFVHWPGAAKSLARIDTAAEERQELRDEQVFHMDVRGWLDIGYNFAVFQSGRVYRLRGIDYDPAGQEGHNTATIAVTCIIGPGDQPSAAMRSALVRLKDHCDKRTGRDLVARPHSAVVQTSCPGDALRNFVSTLNRH